MEARQLLTVTFSLGAFIPASVTYADQAAKLWTPSKQTGGYTLHQTTTTTGPDGSTSTQVVDQDVTSTNSASGDRHDHAHHPFHHDEFGRDDHDVRRDLDVDR